MSSSCPQPAFPGMFSPLPPVAGHTPLAREASQSGAEAARASWGDKQQEILNKLKWGPYSRQEISAFTGISINSVCSCLQALLDAGAVESNGDHAIQVVAGRQTRQERFRLRG